MADDLITVIVPVYNVEPYLSKCLNSILSQTHKNIEIIIVDDGSTDGGPRLCDEFQKLDNRVKVVHKRNGGQASARNVGLDLASGKWVAFLDSDDWIEPDMYETLLKAAVVNDADISSCLTRYCTIDSTPEVTDSNDVINLESVDIIRGLFDGRVRFEVWDKLWKRSLIGDVRFIEGQISEEVYFDRVIFLKAKKMSCIKKTLHNYLVNRPGNTLSSFRKSRLCIFNEIDQLANDLNSLWENEISLMARCWGMDFALSMYIEAKSSGQDTETLKYIKECFKNEYRLGGNQCKNREPKKRMIAELFNFNSNLCYSYVMLKRKVRKWLR